ncbi:DUF6602 domain-containing protein [Curtobacterium sp. UNCCL17]|uniref:DUF6602 domain-containing protein n=1 Tax=Curtobacterium sp. UNCCL17 TaxID=1449051 RepID=UPI000489DFA6|nr:DUF6602 domain-containing protein [Curtobacterium sp. UNCCL17]
MQSDYFGRMTSSGTLNGFVDAVAAQMAADFAASAGIQHRGSKGTVRETGVKDFLKKYLPGTVRVLGSSEVVATNGRNGAQSDILIVDPSTPPIWAAEDFQVVPVECVDAVIEVKSSLTSDELRKAWANIRSVKALPKVAYREQVGLQFSFDVYGRSWPHWPTLGFVFAFSSPNTIEKIGEVFAELARNEPDPALRVDGIFILDRGSVVWYDAVKGTYKPTGLIGDLAATVTSSPGQVLLTALSALHGTLTQVEHRTFDLMQYIAPGIGDQSKLFTTVPMNAGETTIISR